MYTLNKSLKRRVLKHQYTMDKLRCKIKKMREIPGVYWGEVKDVNETGHMSFLIKDNVISISDLKNRKESLIDFNYSLDSGSFFGRGTVNFFRHCERYVAYVLLLLDELENKDC